MGLGKYYVGPVGADGGWRRVSGRRGNASADFYLFIYFIMNDHTKTYIVQEESANKVIKNNKNYDNAKCEIKSHTSSYANMLRVRRNTAPTAPTAPEEKLLQEKHKLTAATL